MAKHLRLLHGMRVNSRIAGHTYMGNPGFGMSRFGRPSFFRNPVAAIKENIVHPISLDGLYTLLGVSVGAVGTTLIPKMVLGSRYDSFLWKIGGNLVSMTVLASATKLITKKPHVAANVLAGGITAMALQLLNGLSKSQPIVAKLTSGMSGLGASTQELLKSRIEEQVRRELGAITAESPYRMGQPRAYPSYRTGVGEYSENEF